MHGTNIVEEEIILQIRDGKTFKRANNIHVKKSYLG